MARGANKNRAGGTARRPAFWWAGLGDEALLDLRFCDLGLSLERSTLKPALRRLDQDLGRRGVRFRPHLWFSEEWFSPDGVPGIAVPFFLAHPRLVRLERRLMHEVEGGNANWLARILRHEAGHALDTAYRLRRRRRWREVFGSPARAYPASYVTQTTSRRYVFHLGHWYAQSHPIEDFAETFAVWLSPSSPWRAHYAQWPVMQKLAYVDELMQEVRESAPLVTSREIVDPLAENRRTLREHYRRKLRAYGEPGVRRYDSELRRVFEPGSEAADGQSAGTRATTFLRRVRPELHRRLVRGHTHPYLVHQVMRMVIHRARELDLRVTRPLRATKTHVSGLMERILRDFVRRGRERFAR